MILIKLHQNYDQLDPISTATIFHIGNSEEKNRSSRKKKITGHIWLGEKIMPETNIISVFKLKDEQQAIIFHGCWDQENKNFSFICNH